MHTAKILVLVMSGMLIAALAILIVGLSLGWHKDNSTVGLPGELSEGLKPNLADSGTTLNFIDLGQPIGTSISDVAEVHGWIAVTLVGGKTPDRIVMLDPSTGEISGVIAVSTSGRSQLVP
ncbi:MAG: hypothetical protein ACJZ9F_04815 [Rhodospirillaceae bacterium]